VPEDLDAVATVKVGDKLSLVPPLEGRYFHFDAVHRLPGDSVLWNGDRRLGATQRAEVAVAISEWLKGSSAKNVFLGCTPHVPGSCGPSITARWSPSCTRSLPRLRRHHDRHPRSQDRRPRMFHLEFSALARTGTPTDGWTEVFKSEMGNVLLVERRVLQYRLVLTCERGLLEIDVSHLPDLVIETARVPMQSGFGVVGRIDGGAFAVTAGTIERGADNMSPAMLVGSPTSSLLDLPKTLRAMPLEASEPERR